MALETAERNRSTTPHLLSQPKMMYNVYMKKICTGCGRLLDVKSFNKDRTRKDGLDHICRQCRKKLYNVSRVTSHCKGCGKEICHRPDRIKEFCRTCATVRFNSTRTREKNPKWVGGKIRSTNGYVLVYDGEHPRAGKSGYVLEHIIVAEKKIGRPLKDSETVHHKNGIRHDNSPGNLEVWASSHPSGQRVEDLVAWVVDNYKEEVIKRMGL